MNAVNPWHTTPRRSVVIFLMAVFFVFAGLGFATDAIDMGAQSWPKFGFGVLISGVFAVAYAYSGVSLRNKFWKAFLPIFATQFLLMGVVARYFPDAKMPATASAAEMERLHGRLVFDGIGIIVSICLGYAGFVFVFISEGRRYIRAHTENALMEGEMAAAREVQRFMLPEQGESFTGYVVDSVYHPARQVGGDFFQILPVAGGGMFLVVGDVAGKGLPAAMLVSMLVGAIRVIAEETHDPVRMLRKLHDRFMGRTGGGFATALAAYIDDDGRVTIANAGHLSPCLDGREIELPGALPLGIAGGGDYEATRFELRCGSRLTFYSDGLVEAQNKDGELFGFARAEEISTEPAAAIVKAAVDYGQSDDITVVTIERLEVDDYSHVLRSRPVLGGSQR